MTVFRWLRVALTCWMLATFFASSAAAQSSATLERFHPSETPYDDFHLGRALGQGHLRLGVALYASYANDPLVYEGVPGESGSERYSVVSDQLTLTATASLGLWNSLVVYAGLPVVALMQGDDASTLASAGVVGADSAGLGDGYIGARFIFPIDSDWFSMGVRTKLTFPTAGSQRLRGDSSLSFLPELVMEVHNANDARIVLNVGARIRENGGEAGTNIAFGDELTFGLGGALPIWHSESDDRTHLDLHAQVYGTSAFQHFFSRNHVAIEGLAGAKFFHSSGFLTGVAGGAGLTRGFGSPDARLVVMFGYVPMDGGPSDRDGDGIADENDQCPDEPEDRDNFEDEDGCPDPDNDQDGILDVNDQCPNEPEDFDNFEDEDGCPDPDNDQDGILDVNDQCPNEPEDFDNFEDENGCPDPDNDQDGVLDVDDRCPLEPGPASNQGCPEPDRDGDGVLDRADNCPDVPGTAENQGCPAPQQVRIEGDQLVILDVVHFKTNRAIIEQRSYGLLDNVAAVLGAHGEISRIRVEGHTDSRGSRASNMRLSQARAEAVVTYLTTRGGVDAARLEAVGYGPDRHIVENARTPDEHARNRRVEFHLLGETDVNVEQRHTGPGADTIDR